MVPPGFDSPAGANACEVQAVNKKQGVKNELANDSSETPGEAGSHDAGADSADQGGRMFLLQPSRSG